MEQPNPSPARKFLFDDNDFGEEALRKKLEAARRPTFSEDQLEAARTEGFNRGRTEGIKQTQDSQEAQIRDVLQQVVLAADRLEQGEAARLSTFIDQATLLSVQALTKLCPAMLNIFALEQIKSFVAQVLSSQIKAQQIRIHVAPTHTDQINTRLQEAVAGMRRKIDYIITPDDTLTNQQCRFEWTGGGAEWDPQATTTQLLDTLYAHLPEHLKPHAQDALDETDTKPHNDPDNQEETT